MIDRGEKDDSRPGVPDFIAVSPATLEMFTTDDPPFSLDPFTAAAALRKGCISCRCWESG